MNDHLDARTIGPAFPASWPGLCPGCRTVINTGDLCRLVDGYAWCQPCATRLEDNLT